MEAIETNTIEQDGHTYRIAIYPDPDAPNPLNDWSEMGTILSLNRRHCNFDPAGVEAAIENNPDAVPLCYYEHGLCHGLSPESCPPACPLPLRFGAIRRRLAARRGNAGIRQNYGGRTRRHFMRKRARQACDAYTQWCNGDVYSNT